MQPSQAIMQPTLSQPDYGPSLAQAGPAYSLVDGDEVFATAGLIKQWDNRAIAWALISAEAGPHFFLIHKAVRRALLFHSFRRVETAVKTDFQQGHRWAELLGFSNEGTMSGYAPDGSDYDLYARVQNV